MAPADEKQPRKFATIPQNDYVTKVIKQTAVIRRIPVSEGKLPGNVLACHISNEIRFLRGTAQR